MKPFILAFGRQTIARIIEPYLDRIVEINTDGFKSTEELTGLVFGTGCGELRHEGIV